MEPGAYLAINALGSTDRQDPNNPIITRRRLEINWYGLDPYEDQYQVVLFTQLPNENMTKDEVNLVIHPHDHIDDFYVTNIQLENVTNEEIGYQSRCVFPLWVQVRDLDGTPVTDPRCLQSQPNWMFEHREIIGDLAVGELMLTAAHDAAAYK